MVNNIDPAQYQADVARALEAADAYYNGDSELMSDSEYDAMLDAILDYETANPDEAIAHGLHTSVAAGLAASDADVPHPAPMLSLDKVKTYTEIREFLGRISKSASSLYGTTDDAAVLLEPKLDGMAVRAVYKNGQLVQVVTRGDGAKGEDVTDRLARSNVQITGLPFTVQGDNLDFEVRGEILMSTTDFQFSNKNRQAAGKTAFANPRNATAGTVRAGTLDYDAKLTLIAYGTDRIGGLPSSFTHSSALLESAGFGLGVYTDVDELIADVEKFGALRETYNYPTDGVVIKAFDLGIRGDMGDGSRAPKWAVAYKYEAQKARTVLRDIELAVGRSGAISFTAILDPVLVDGSTVGRATLHNYDFIVNNDLRIGDTVEVYKANDIIPRVVRPFVELRPADAAVYDPPRVCPVSGEPLDTTSSVIWRSLAPEASLAAAIEYAASRDALDIDGLGSEIAIALTESGLVSDIGDLFSLTEKELTELTLGENRTLGQKNAAKLVAAIDAARSQSFNRVLTAFGIRNMGRTFGRRLSAHFKNMDAILAASEADYAPVEGIGEGDSVRARRFVEGFRRNAAAIEKLRAAGVTMAAEEVAGATNTLAGMKVVVSGGMTGALAAFGRNEMNELIEKHGGKSSGSVSSSTSLLVTSDASTSKGVKATELGVRIVTPEEFAAELGM